MNEVADVHGESLRVSYHSAKSCSWEIDDAQIDARSHYSVPAAASIVSRNTAVSLKFGVSVGDFKHEL